MLGVVELGTWELGTSGASGEPATADWIVRMPADDHVVVMPVDDLVCVMPADDITEEL